MYSKLAGLRVAVAIVFDYLLRGCVDVNVSLSRVVVTNAWVSRQEKQQRHEWSMKQIDKGVGFSELASLVAETWGCSRRQAHRVVSDAHKEWMDAAFADDPLGEMG